MNAKDIDARFSGSIPQLYETYLVPMIFEPYALDLANRVAALKPSRVLEVACGTGVVTRHLAAVLPDADIVATDLNQPMLDLAAKSMVDARAIQWRQADAMNLGFEDESFDVVVCQFGVMFFPDKTLAFSEARRVLKPGGALVFNVWDQIEQNEFADVVTQGLAQVFPADPPRFAARVPHGYFDRDRITADLAGAGFSAPDTFDTWATRSRADSPMIPAIAYCQGTPLRNEIEARGGVSLEEATQAAAAAMRARFGAGAVDGKIQAHIIVVLK